MSTQTIIRTAGSTSQSTELSLVQDSTSAAAGDPVLGLLFNTTSLVARSTVNIGADAAVALVTQTPTGAYASGGFVAVPNKPGQFRFDIPNALLAVAGEANITWSGLPAGTAGKMETHSLKIMVTAFDFYNVANAFKTQMTETTAAKGIAPTPEQALILMYDILTNFKAAGLLATAYKLDGVTPAATFTIDDANNPTQILRAT